MSIEQHRRFSEWAASVDNPDPEHEDFDSLLDGLDPMAEPVSKHTPGGKDHDQSTHGRKRRVVQGDNWYAESRVAGALNNATAAYDEHDEQMTEDEARDFALDVIMATPEYDDITFNVLQDSSLGTQPHEPDHMKAAANFRLKEGGNLIVFKHPTIAKTVLLHEIAHMHARDHGLDWADTYLTLLQRWHPEAFKTHIAAVEGEVKDISAISISKHRPGGKDHDQSDHGKKGPTLFDPEPFDVSEAAFEVYGDQTALDIPDEPPPPRVFERDDLPRDEYGVYWRYDDGAYDLEGRDFVVRGVPGRGKEVVRDASQYLHDADRLADPIGASMAGDSGHHPAFKEEGFVIREDVTGEQTLLIYREGKNSSEVAWSVADSPDIEGSHVIHSHPSSSALSHGDILFGHRWGAESITAIANEGAVFTATYGTDRSREGMLAFKKSYMLAQKLTDKAFELSASYGINTPDEWEERRHAFLAIGGHMRGFLHNEAVNIIMGDNLTIQHNADGKRWFDEMRSATNANTWEGRYWVVLSALLREAPPDVREKATMIDWESAATGVLA